MFSKFFASIILSFLAFPVSGVAAVVRHSGMCDASAAVAVGSGWFMVANDKDSVLRVYDREHPGQPLYTQDFSDFLKVRNPETDFEGATRIGNRIYWITSHGTNGKGEPQPHRRRLFATEVQLTEDKVSLTAIGVPYRTLVEDLAKTKALKAYDLSRAAAMPPEHAGGLNIEGLSRTPQGGLLIAFRNPLPGRNALLVPLDNPEEVLNGTPAKFGQPVLLALGGRGIRSIEYSDVRAKYLIVAGPYHDEGVFGLFEWSGLPTEQPVQVKGIDFEGLNPEALVVYPDRETEEQVLSDDRGEKVDGMRCLRRISDRQSFRSRWLSH